MGGVAYQVLHASEVPVLLIRSGMPQTPINDKLPQQTILVPLDHSQIAESALPHAEALAKQRGVQAVEILLLNVCEPYIMPEEFYYVPPDYPQIPPLKYEDYVKQEKIKTEAVSRLYLEKIAKKFKSEGIKVRTEVLMGNPAEEIIKYANQNPFPMIIMASHGRTGFQHLVLGSVAEKVVLQANIPVLIVKPHD